ncbi:MAG: TetR family transcriptional regulator [Nocardioides sp.]|uniref:TetR/AcrR family transcriptional regulator n=1 Tax=Nocardioides sp. TaxID=35761 RepID=UPI0039E65BF3
MGRPNRQEERRIALIQAAQSAVLEHGLIALSLTDVAKQAGLTRGALLYYFDDLDALLVETHRAGIQRFCDDRDARLADVASPADQLALAIDIGLPSGPDDALMRLLYEFDFLAGHSELHADLVQQMYLRQLATYRGVLGAGVATGEFAPTIAPDELAMDLVALEDAYSLHIVAGNTHLDVPTAARAMRSVAAGLGCPPG